MLKRLLTYILLLPLLTGCSDSFDIPGSNEIGEDGSVVMTLDIPTIREGLTRTGEINPECKVKDITILIFNEETAPGQSLTIYDDPSNNTGNARIEQLNDSQVKLRFRIKKELMSDTGKLRFYFIANCPTESLDLQVDGKSLEELTENELKEVLSSVIFHKSGEEFVMCGKATFSDLTSNQPVLTRNAAKVSVTMGETGIPFEIFGAASSSPLLSGINSDANSSKGSVVAPAIFPDDLTDNAIRYIHPTVNSLLKNDNKNYLDNLSSSCYVIVKAPFNGEDYYYRLDFILPKNNKSGEYSALSPTANHWYKFEVTEITGPGYSTPEEASRHPEEYVEYDIHDHSPLSFNMASDGVRELGVTHDIVYDGLPTEVDNLSQSYINIKFFSKHEGEIPESSEEVRKLITIEDDWLELTDPVQVYDNNDLNGVDREGDSNDTGVIYRFKLNFKSNNLIGDITNNITVRWMGLERVIPVTWERNFNGAAVTTAKLTINYNGTPLNDIDYWAFLSSTDNSSTSSPVKLWGIQEGPNNGKIRNQGFHFPVMYGTDGNYASYSYTLSFNESVIGTKTIADCTVSIEGDDGIKNVVATPTTTSKSVSLSITRPGNAGNNDYTYAVGRLKVKIKFSDGDTDEYSFGLYHTGFFHKDTSGKRMDTDSSSGDWRYYEVVPVKVNNTTRYILDRNLGAKSAEMYIRYADGSTLTGNPEAAGGYYKVAKQENPTAYKDPSMFDDIGPRVSPPGYCVPKQNVWDAIRNSQSFHTENVGDYFNCYYDTKDTRIGKVYFPKAMFYRNNDYAGETRDGYYWTSTASTGTEKEEIGKWLKMLTISGNTTSYTNGCVEVPGKPTLAYGASLRCINKVQESTVIKRTSFNVAGATHVYLYQDKNGERIGTTTWPGHAIGNYDTMVSGNWFGFSFESTDFDPDDLYVIFNFVDGDGIIHTFSQDNDGTTLCTTDISLLSCKGWKVKDENYPILKGEHLILNGEVFLATDKTALGQWWLCDVSNGNVNIYKTGTNATPTEILSALNHTIPVESGNKRIFLDHSVWWEKVYIYHWYGDTNNGWPGTLMNKVLAGTNRYWYCDITDKAQYIIFNNGNGGAGNQTNNIYIGNDAPNTIYSDNNLQ